MGTNYQISIIIGVGRGGRNNWGLPPLSWHPVYDAGGCERSGSGGGMGRRGDMVNGMRDLGGRGGERRDGRPMMVMLGSRFVRHMWLGMVRLRRLRRLRRPGGRLVSRNTLELRRGGREPFG